MSDVTLSKAVRSNLLSLQNTANMMASTQNRLATGNKVNSALDNPTNFFTASSLNSRAGDMNALLDDMANGIQTIEAADNGLTAITKTLESMQSTLRQARQDKSFKTESFTFTADNLATTDTLDLSGGAIGSASIVLGTDGTEATVTGAGGTDWSTDTTVFETSSGGGEFDGMSITITAENGDTDTYTIQNGDTVADVIAALSDGDFTVTGSATGFNFEHAGGSNFTVTASDPTLATAIGVGTTATSTDGVEAGTISIDDLVLDINENYDGLIRASNDNGKLRIENLSTTDLEVTAPTGVSGATKIEGNAVRADLATQYNELRDQLDKLADDASFNGINLLRGDNLKITFNETGTSDLEIQSRIDGENGVSINSATLGIDTNMTAAELDSDEGIDGFLAQVKSAINTVRSQASAFGSSLSIVENRQNFTKNMINTLQTGASNLTLADANEEAANLLALQTRQQLSSTALSMASQADQAVLRLF